jgi:predicted TIM-barrel fold metal-dependent hydrolase
MTWWWTVDTRSSEKGPSGPARDLQFFDLNAMVGQPVFDPESGLCSGYADSRSLVASMDRSGVELALVSHFRGIRGDPMKANEALLSDIAGSARLFPCFRLLPETIHDPAARQRLSDLIARGRVRAARIPVGDAMLCASTWGLAELFRFLEEREMLAILQFPHLGVAVPERDDPYLDVLDRLLAECPRIRVVTLGRLRGFFPLMERHAKLLTSLEWDPHPDFVEAVTRRFGAHRILFATPWSENARDIPGMPMLMVSHADVSADDKAKVAGGNLASILGVPLPPVASAVDRSPFRAVLRGEPIGESFIDVHAHVGEWGWEHKPATGAAELLRAARPLGLTRAYINSTEAVVGGDHLRGNAEIAEAVRAEPNALRGFVVFNPNFDGGAAYLKRSLGTEGFRGIKIHPRIHRCAITDPRYRPVWEASEGLRVPVLCHTGQGQAFSEPDQLDEIAPRFSKSSIILAHTGETFAGMEQCIRLLGKHGNLSVDVSGWLFMKRGMLEYLVRRADTERILYGSDYSWIDARYALATVLFADIDGRTRTRILSGNARRIIAD